MDLSNFEQFIKTGSKTSNYTISISKFLGFGLNSGFYSKNKISEFSHAVLFYSDIDKSIAFLFTNNEIKGRFAITHSENKTSGSVVCRSFFISYDLDKIINDIAGKYPPHPENHPQYGKIFIIKLGERIVKKNQ